MSTDMLRRLTNCRLLLLLLAKLWRSVLQLFVSVYVHYVRLLARESVL